MRFVSVGKGDVYLYEKKVDASSASSGVSVIPAMHGQQITSVAVLRVDPDGITVATGSEDTTVRITSIHFSPGDGLTANKNRAGISSHHVLSTLTRHISSVRALKHLRDDYDDDGVFLISGGGRAQLCAWKLTLAPNQAQATLLADHRGHSAARKNHRKPTRRVNGVAQEEEQLSDLRFMSLDVVRRDGEQALLIAAAGSDGFLRLFRLDLTTKEMRICARTAVRYGARCLLHVQFFRDDTKRGHLILANSSTDGVLSVWRIESPQDTEKIHAESQKDDHDDDDDDDHVRVSSVPKGKMTFRWTQSVSCHQSGFSHFDLRKTNDDGNRGIRCVSGGDDNAIRVMTFNCEDDNNDVENFRFTKGEVQKPFTIADAHATQITSVHWIDHRHFVSVSIDQRVNVWQYQCDAPRGTSAEEQLFKLLASAMTDVADVAASALVKAQKKTFLVIVGIGLQLLELELDFVETE